MTPHDEPDEIGAPPLTTTQRAHINGGEVSHLTTIETALTRALEDIRNHWDHMLHPSTGGSIARGAGGKVTLADDHSDTEADTPRIDRIVSLRREVAECLNSWSRIVAEDRHIANPTIRCDHGARITLTWPKVGPTHPTCASLIPWAVDLETQHPTPGLHAIRGGSVADMVAFLLIHAQWFSGHEAAEDAAGELRKWAHKVRMVTEPARKDWVGLGACPLDVDDGKCGGQVRARGDRAACRRCGTDAEVKWWEHVLMPEASRLVTAAELPEFVRAQFGKIIKEPTVRKWIERGVITAAGSDEKGRTLYDKGAVAYALARREMMGA